MYITWHTRTSLVIHAGARRCCGYSPTGRVDRVLSARLTRLGRWPVHDRGWVLADLAVMIADERGAISDVDVLRHQHENVRHH